MISLKVKGANYTRRIGLAIVVVLIQIRRPKFALTYYGKHQQDGTGAQLQRILAIYSLCKSIGIRYVHSGIEEVAIHPLDSHQSEDSYQKYLLKLNEFAQLPSDIGLDKVNFDNLEIITKFRLRDLVRLTFASKTNTHVIAVVEVHAIMDCRTSMYEHARSALAQKLDEFSTGAETNLQVIAVHYRAIPGEVKSTLSASNSRQLSLNRLDNVLSKLSQSPKFENSRIVVFTDAPNEDLRIPVPAQQTYLWEGTPGYSNGHLHLPAVDLNSIFQKYSWEYEIIVGGDPLDAIIRMAKSRCLVMSKSSLSYVAYLLSEKVDVYAPIEFWHPVPNSRKY